MDAGLLGLVVEDPSAHEIIKTPDDYKMVYVLIDHPIKKIRRWHKNKCEVVNEAR